MNSMSAVLPRPIWNQNPPAPPATPPAPAPPANPPADDDKKDITIGQAITALGSAVVVAGIETVGNTASSIVNAPRATYYAYKALWNTEMIGPVLKTTIGALLPVATVAAPVLTALGSCGFGLVRGFTESLEGGMGQAVKTAVSDVKYFHKDLAGKLVEELGKYEVEQLPPGQKPYDIKVLEAGKALVGGVAAGAVDGVGIGLITLVRTPQGTFKLLSEIWKSDQGPVLKTTETLLVPLGVVLATPLATVAGAVYGLATGAKEGYTNGLGAAAKKAGENVKDYWEATGEMLKD